jgi:hypothetical protein
MIDAMVSNIGRGHTCDKPGIQMGIVSLTEIQIRAYHVVCRMHLALGMVNSQIGDNCVPLSHSSHKVGVQDAWNM